MNIVGTTKVAGQHRKVLLENGFLPDADGITFTSPSRKLWMVDTWQGVYARCRKDELDLRVALLYFDECHLGGSSASNKSYRKIVETLNPTKKVHVSATTNVASEALLGEREDHSYIFTLSAAYEDGLLNPVNIVEVETGTSVMVERIERAFGESMDDHDGPVSQSPSRRVQRFFLVSQRRCRPAGRQSLAHLCDVPAAAVHSQEGEIVGLLSSFEVGEIKVIFAVNMLQEGFNMPSLRLAFDCRFHRQLNNYRIARMMQRIGRLMRKMQEKSASLYYVAPDLTHYYISKNAAIRATPASPSLRRRTASFAPWCGSSNRTGRKEAHDMATPQEGRK